MKNGLLYIFFCLALSLVASTSLLAQTDSTTEQEVSRSERGLERLQAMIDQAESYRKSNSRQSLSYAQEALRHAQNLKTENLLSKTGTIYDTQKLGEAKVTALTLSGIAYKAQRRRSRALKALREAQNLAVSISFEAGERRARLILKELDASAGINNFLNATISKVGTLIDGTVEVDKKVKTEVAARSAAINENTAKRAEANGDYERAIEFYKKSIKYYVSIKDTVNSTALSQHIARLYEKLGKPKESEEIIAITESAKKIPADTSTSVQQDIDDFVEDLKTIAEASKPAPEVLAEEKKAELKHQSTLRLAKSLARSGNTEASIQKFEEAYTLQAMLIKFKSERQMDSLTNELFIEKILDERDIYEQKAEDTLEDRNFFILIAFLFLAVAALAAWLFFTKRKSHNQVSRAYEKLEETHQELKSTQTQLVAAEKMASLGQLTAGIAHEINNPVNFISGNIHPLKSDISELMQLLNAYENIVQHENLKDKFTEIVSLKEGMDFDYLKEEIQELLAGMEEGATRTTEIVKGLRMFARVDEEQPKPVDLHMGLDNTLALLKGQLKDIEIIRDYGEIPVIDGFPGKINQVFMNVLTNAIQAIPGEGWIGIKTRVVGAQVEIRIQDTGKGIDKDTINRIYEPFFTTKELGEGTGLGLSISLGILKQHGGHIDIESIPGQGTEVILSLPYLTV